MVKSFTEKFASKKKDVSKASSTPKKNDNNSFMDKLINSRGDLCYKITGRDSTGETAWYFLLVDKDKKEKLLSHNNGDRYNLEDYGKVIISGYGEVVPKHVQEMLKEKYNFDKF